MVCRFLTLDEQEVPKCMFGHSTSRKNFCIDGKEAKDRNYVLKGRRQCTRCGKLYSAMEFYRDRHYPDGIDVYCKYCRKELNMRYQEKRLQKILRHKDLNHGKSYIEKH